MSQRKDSQSIYEFKVSEIQNGKNREYLFRLNREGQNVVYIVGFVDSASKLFNVRAIYPAKGVGRIGALRGFRVLIPRAIKHLHEKKIEVTGFTGTTPNKRLAMYIRKEHNATVIPVGEKFAVTRTFKRPRA